MLGERCCRIGLTAASPWIFSSHRQFGTGSVAVTATCATTPLCLSTLKQKHHTLNAYGNLQWTKGEKLACV